MSHYNGFDYEEFYEFIVDFFGADQTPEGKTASKELCDWWNRYVSDSISIITVIDASLEKSSQGLLLLRQPRCGNRCSQSYDSESGTEPACSPCRPSSF